MFWLFLPNDYLEKLVLQYNSSHLNMVNCVIHQDSLDTIYTTKKTFEKEIFKCWLFWWINILFLNYYLFKNKSLITRFKIILPYLLPTYEYKMLGWYVIDRFIIWRPDKFFFCEIVKTVFKWKNRVLEILIEYFIIRV